LVDPDGYDSFVVNTASKPKQQAICPEQVFTPYNHMMKTESTPAVVRAIEKLANTPVQADLYDGS
jgi:hypothetical protein